MPYHVAKSSNGNEQMPSQAKKHEKKARRAKIRLTQWQIQYGTSLGEAHQNFSTSMFLAQEHLFFNRVLFLFSFSSVPQLFRSPKITSSMERPYDSLKELSVHSSIRKITKKSVTVAKWAGSR